MKLTKEIICNYLPFGLEAEMLDYKSDYVGLQYDKIVGIHQWDGAELYWSVLTAGGSKPEIGRIKPILRPLSCVFEEIEHKGERFVPVYVLRDMFGSLVHGIYSAPDYLSLRFQAYDSRSYVDMRDIISIKNKLSEWHIDYNGLIEAGLAHDKNKIDYENKRRSN